MLFIICYMMYYFCFTLKIIIMDIEIELKDAKKTLKEEEYKLRWGGYVHPYDYIRSAQYTVTRYWRNKVEELEKKIENSKQ